MAAMAGAGASVSSGADYQARIGAYLLVSSICGVSSSLAGDRAVASLGFETTEEIDDINVVLTDGTHVYIQAKSTIQYSLTTDSQLRSVLDQFLKQHLARPDRDDQYQLVTSGKSSRKITYDMRAALEAFRLGPEASFRRDQPVALVQIVDELISTLLKLQGDAGREPDADLARAVLRKAFVHALDIDNGTPLEQSLLLVLHTRHFAAPSAFFGKVIADCLGHAKARHTLDTMAASSRYTAFRVESGAISEKAADELMGVEFADFNFAVGREVVLARFNDTPPNNFPPLAVMEFYRFDENCQERIVFEGDTLVLGNGMRLSLLRRAATQTGLTRLMQANPALIGDEEIGVWPINSDEDFEVGLCAETHRARLKQAAIANARPLMCVHCGRPVSSNTASMVEMMQEREIVVGLSHDQCLAPDDRVMGTVRNEFFERHPELVNFDLNAWHRAAIHGGQAAFANAKQARAGQVVVAWGGRRPRGPSGYFVVEMMLQGGTSEFVASRHAIHRLSKADAEGFVARVEKAIQEDGATDPLCYTDQTKAFGRRSTLIEQFGGKERLLAIERALIRPFEERFAARYARPGHWYAPLAYLRDLSTGEPVAIMGSVVLITSPFALANHLVNWRESGIEVTNYEVASLLSDQDFDDFMRHISSKGLSAVTDPMFTTDQATSLASGVPIRAVEDLRD